MFDNLWWLSLYNDKLINVRCPYADVPAPAAAVNPPAENPDDTTEIYRQPDDEIPVEEQSNYR